MNGQRLENANALVEGNLITQVSQQAIPARGATVIDGGGRPMVPDLRKRGRVQEGAIADLTIFDPATVTDNADWAPGKNSLPSTGIPYVIVNGTVVVRDSRVLKDVLPGKAIRNPIVPD